MQRAYNVSPRRPHVVVDKAPWWHGMLGAAGAAFLSGTVVFAITWGTNQQRLTDHDKQFAQVEQRNTNTDAALTAIQSKLQDIKKADDEARSKIRDEFLKRSEETAKGIAELNTKAAVQETRLGQVVETLKTISVQLDTALRPAHPPEQRR